MPGKALYHSLRMGVMREEAEQPSMFRCLTHNTHKVDAA